MKLSTFEVVLARGSDERHYYVEAGASHDAIMMAKLEWGSEFPGPAPKVVSSQIKDW